MKRLAAYHWAHVEKSQNTVFVLLSKPDNQIVGVFSSITQAEQAHDHLTNTNDFTIETYTLDQLA